jgi:serine protease AprX
LNADPSYTGKGVGIGFLDGGFYPHPDIMKPTRRVIAYKDLGSPHRPKSDFEKPDMHSWHGMQTCVSAVGNGYLSNGLYKGLAYDSNVALLKVRGEFGFTTDAIVAGIEWCIRKKKRYNIRVLNISLGVDGDGSFRESVINHAAEEAVQAGINVVVAAGNEDWVKPTPPANSPSVITVGGLDDRNSLHQEDHGMYHSTFGITADGIMKPEIIAPGIWVAAPTLPGTPFYRESELIWLAKDCQTQSEFEEFLERNDFKFSFQQELDSCQNFDQIRQLLQRKVGEYKLISPHYQHVDGTSFSAPIVCSIIAQMLEVNPDLAPRNVKDILMESATRLDNIAVEKQGCGVVQARAAVELASKRVYGVGYEYPQVHDNKVSLKYDGLAKTSVDVLGGFNDWRPGADSMTKNPDGTWSIDMELKNLGTFPYKFLVDGEVWRDDPLNTNKVYDGFGGFNSMIEIYGTADTRKILTSVERRLSTLKSVRRQTKRHRKLLMELDEVFSHECIAKSPSVKDFYARRIQNIVSNIKKNPIKNGICLHQLYNCGYIIQTPTLNIGIDVVTGRHVWDVYWDVDKKIINELTELLDISFVTHRLPDHLDLDVVNKLIADNKLVVVPSGMENLCLNGVIGFEKDESRDLYSLGASDTSIHVDSYPGHYRLDGVSELDMRMYKISIQEKLNILHMGEHDYKVMSMNPNRGFHPKRVGKVHLLITPLPINDEPNEIESWERMIDQINPDVVIPTHLAELGQKSLMMRGSYKRAYELLEKTSRQFETLVWGDFINICFKDQIPEEALKELEKEQEQELED